MRRVGITFCESKSRFGVDSSEVNIELAGLIVDRLCSNMLLDESLQNSHIPLKALGSIIQLESHPVVYLGFVHAYLL